MLIPLLLDFVYYLLGTLHNIRARVWTQTPHLSIFNMCEATRLVDKKKPDISIIKINNKYDKT